MRMYWRSILFLLLGILLSMPSKTYAEENYREFLDGLRSREYYDYAMIYLDQLGAQEGLPIEMKQIVPYEKAVTLLSSVNKVGSPQAQSQMLDEALIYLDQFVKEAPRHPKAAQANTERARILLGKGRVEVWESRSPSNVDNRAEFQERARAFIKQARDIFQKAHDGHKGTWESFPKFIDKSENSKEWEARRQAEIKYIRAQLDLSLCTYEEAQTYDPGSPDYVKILTNASMEFEAIHKKYRSQVGGLYARMWQGKCFEEQDDIKKALGIYNELLGHPGKSSPMQRLQNQVRQFRLICLNHEQRNDFQLVIIEADEWLNSHRSQQRTSIGLGIRWEMVLAQESVASDRSTEMKDSDRDRLLQQALTNARFINRYPGQYNDISMFKIRDLQVKLKGNSDDPQDFDTALGLARNLVKGIAAKNEAVAAAKGEEKTKALEDKNLHLAEAIRILELSLNLATDDTASKDLNQARYFLSYTYYLSRRSYESAILGKFIAQHYREDNEQMALDSAYLAMAAFVQAYNDSPKDQKQVDMDYMLSVCKMITDHWPESDRANDARMQMGRIYSQMNQAVQAAEWYSQIPEKAPQYADAQSNAGQAYWTAYLEAAVLPDDQKPKIEELQKWQAAAQTHLQNGITRLTQLNPEGAKPPDELIAAKVSLAQIVIGDGKYQEAIDLILKAPHPVEPAITVAKEEDRKPNSITSSEFASLVYQLLLRSYVGIQDLDKARATMNKLEVVAEGSGGGEAVTAIYVQLGKKLEDELKTLKGLGDQDRVSQVRKSFETFLDDLFKRPNQTYGSLVWISETYYGLATGSEGEKDQAQKYFDRAATTYQSIIDRAATEGDKFADASRLSGVKLRLVNCRRRQGSFDQALELIADILAEKPKALDAQIEAAFVLQDKAGSDEYEMYLEAINGKAVGAKKDVPIWGWSQIALRLQRLLMAGGADSKDKYGDKYLEARYNLSYCRHQLGVSQSNTNKKKEILESAKTEITAFVLVTVDITDEWWDKLDTLYQQIQRDMGDAEIVKLERPKVIAEAPPQAVAQADTKPAPTKAPKKAPKPKVEEAGSSGMIWGVLGIILAIGVAAGFYFMVAGQDKKRRAAYANAVPAEMPKRRPPSAKPKARKPQARKPQGQARKPQAKQGKPAASGGKSSEANPKPKSKPPKAQ